jgi:hypothetical protein
MRNTPMKRFPKTFASVTIALWATLPAAAQRPAAGFIPVTDQMLQKPDPADWLMSRRTLAEIHARGQ